MLFLFVSSFYVYKYTLPLHILYIPKRLIVSKYIFIYVVFLNTGYKVLYTNIAFKLSQ